MSKRLLVFWGLLAVCGLVACQAAASPTLAPTETPVSTSTSIPVVPTATLTVAKTPEKEEPKPTATTAMEADAAVDAEPPWQIPTVREEDWAKGGADAGLVVVEYSDYQ